MNAPWYFLIFTIIGVSIFYFFPNFFTRTKLPQIVNLPQLLGAVSTSLPKADELIEPKRKEELYLKAPMSFTLPEIKIQNYDQEITVQLDPYEIRDSRRGGKDWQLIINSQDLISDKGIISKSNIAFRLDKNDIQSVTGSVDDLTITDGPRMTIEAKDGMGKGTFVFRPKLIIKIPQGSYSGNYKSQLESELN